MMKCADCRYYRSGVSSLSPIKYRDGIGECRRHAPRGPVVLATGQAETMPITLTAFPILPDDDWCGEFSPRGECHIKDGETCNICGAYQLKSTRPMRDRARELAMSGGVIDDYDRAVLMLLDDMEALLARRN